MNSDNITALIFGATATALGGMWAWASTRPDCSSESQQCFRSCRYAFTSEKQQKKLFKCYKICMDHTQEQLEQTAFERPLPPPIPHRGPVFADLP